MPHFCDKGHCWRFIRKCLRKLQLSLEKSALTVSTENNIAARCMLLLLTTVYLEDQQSLFPIHTDLNRPWDQQRYHPVDSSIVLQKDNIGTTTHECIEKSYLQAGASITSLHTPLQTSLRLYNYSKKRDKAISRTNRGSNKRRHLGSSSKLCLPLNLSSTDVLFQVSNGSFSSWIVRVSAGTSRRTRCV